MRKTILILIAVISMLTSYSQTEKGKYFIGGSINYSGDKDSEGDSVTNNWTNKNTTFNFTPSIGYFVTDNIAVGINLNLGNSVYNYQILSNMNYYSTTKTNTLNLGGGIFVRPYFKISNNFMFFINAGISYIDQPGKITFSTTQPGVSPTPDQKILGYEFTANIYPGLVYFVTPKIGLSVSVGNLFYDYSYRKNKESGIIDKNTFSGINLNSSTLSVGLTYHF
jgi:hypothetical protein